MLDFEEELKRFRPSIEIGDVENMIASEDLTDMSDLMVKLMADEEKQETPGADV